MKTKLFLFSLFSWQLLFAQSFTEVPQAFPFEGAEWGSVTFSDVDGDGDPDVLITGRTGSEDGITILYLNEGGSFSKAADTPFDGVDLSSVAFSDVDGDGDPDVLITGGSSSGPIAKLYLNEGGFFSEAAGTPFEGVQLGSVAFADVDGDGDQDLLVTGRTSSIEHIAKLYTNNGASFTEVAGTPFDGVSGSSVTFADVDGDSDQDVLITGLNGSEEYIAKLYTNDEGSFTEVANTPFEGVFVGSTAFADVDGDGDNDVLITGVSPSGLIAKLYTNDEGGHFTEVEGTPFDGIELGSVTFSDVDGDADQDVLITGGNSSGLIAKLYSNEGGSYTEVMRTPFDGVRWSSADFGDVDGDGDDDLIIAGGKILDDPIVRLYSNEGGSFIGAPGTPFESVSLGSNAFSDVDGDGDQDVLITGQNALSDEPTAKLYTNDGGNFTEMMNTPFEGVRWSSVAFADVDRDGDNDVLITGFRSVFNIIAKLYLNDGGSFTEARGTSFEEVAYSSVAFADIDGDNDPDLLITGRNFSSEPIAKLYTNDGGSFTEVSGTSFEGVESGSVAFADVDSDGDQDVLITGLNASSEPTAKLYANDGGNFTEVSGTPFDGVAYGSIAFSDVNGDGDQDVLITGNRGEFDPITKLYTNVGGTFTEVADTPFDGAFLSSVTFSDVDGDEDGDLMITGLTASSMFISKLYTNENGSFTEVENTPFDGVAAGTVSFSDVDSDGDQDVLITGDRGQSDPIAKLYLNDRITSSDNGWVAEKGISFVLYPNPTKGTDVNVRYDATESSLITITIFDLLGRPLRQQQQRAVVGEQTFLLDITSLPRGSYFIQLADGRKSGTRKFMIH